MTFQQAAMLIGMVAAIVAILAGVVGIFMNLHATNKLAFVFGQKVQKIEEHERRIGEAETELREHTQKISDHHVRIGVLESDVKAIQTRVAR